MFMMIIKSVCRRLFKTQQKKKKKKYVTTMHDAYDPKMKKTMDLQTCYNYMNILSYLQ